MTETPLHEITTSRILPARLERALNSALSRGPGYEPTPVGRAFAAEAVNGYYIDFQAKTASRIAGDPANLLPAPLAQLALGWWERHLTGDPVAPDRFIEVCGLLEKRGESVAAELRWPARVPVPKYGLVAPWCSALTQGQAASAFVRAHLLTGEDRYAELALRAIQPLLGDRPSDLVVQTRSGPIFEEAPGEPASHILNGWITALWGVRDVHLGLGHKPAGEVFAAGVGCLRAHLPAYDTGWWSRYSLYAHPLEDLAKPIYHRYHVDQLTVLHRLTGVPEFIDTARRWAEYDRPVRRALALAQKGMFALADAPRRRRFGS